MVFVKVLAFATMAFCVANLLAVVPTIQALDCFACHSVNGSDRRCEDPMIRIYEGFLKPETCALPTKIVNQNQNQDDQSLMDDVDVMGENGTMIEKGPGYQVGPPRDDGTIEIMESYCVKIIGTTIESKVNIVIRTCIDQDLNSQCGILTFKDKKIRGCMLTCQENMCNEGPPQVKIKITLLILALILTITFF